MRQHLLFFIFLFSLSLSAQHSIQSLVVDSKNGLPVELGTIRLLRASDSTLVAGCRTDTKGSFILPKVKPGSYVLKINSIGYNEYKHPITVENRDVLLKSIQLVENPRLLNEVQVTGTAAQMVVKGDTMEYNATAFKTPENAVTEDLLKRLPGVEVTTDGKITVNGQEIKKIRVDGKKFFNDDIEMTTKNLPADMIDKIQVLEQKSDMAKLTGFEDNDTERIINITTKPNRRKGVFGNVMGGGGLDTNLDPRYDANAFVNIMDGEAQTAVTGGANNINTTRSGRGRFSGWGGASSGITATQNLGLNNNTVVNKKLKIGGDASFNHAENVGQSLSEKESYLKDLQYNDSDSTASVNGNYSTSMRLEMEWKPDSMNTFVVQPNFSYNRSFSDSYRNYLYRTEGDSTSWGNSTNNGNGWGIDGGLNVIYNRRFAKPGRSFTANVGAGLSHSENESTNISIKKTRTTAPPPIDQKTFSNTDRLNYNVRMSFVEPLWNVKNMLETAVSFRNTTTDSKKDQYNRDEQGAYNQKDTVYSNTFGNVFHRESLELNYRYAEKNYNLMLGIKAEPAQTSNQRYYANGVGKDTTYGVVNFAPTARFQYNFEKKKFIRVDYRGQTNQPSINQMQPVKNNSNLMNETVGNPGLDPEFSQNLRMFFSSFNDKTFSSFSAMVMADATKDALVSNSLYDETGKQYSQTVNSKAMPYRLNSNIMFNTPIIQKRLHFNTSTSGSYEMRYGYSTKGMSTADIDIEHLRLGDLSSTRRWGVNEQLSLTLTHDVVEIGASGTARYSNTTNNLSLNTSKTWDWTGRGNVVLHLPYKINFASDLNYTTRQGYSNFDQDELIWNASVDKVFLKNKGVLALKWIDILGQQKNIRQTIGDNYIQYNKYNTLTSYFILSFLYKINEFKGSGNRPFNPDQRFGPGGDRPHGGGQGGYMRNQMD
ncbi:MAG TPA: outer membrane beta-barrel protein [Paludibacter sp.]|nr:outer membrane beta-barrel protein [Paludibacter sp.]